MAREIWSSRTGFILAAVGSAVGLGNIWRFSYVAYENGGGAFLIPYFVALFTAGIPLLILEFSLGGKFRATAPLALKRARSGFEPIGWWAALSGLLIAMYYPVVIGWSLVYLGKAFTLGWGEDTNAYFYGTVLQLTGSPWDLGGFQASILISLLVVWAMTWTILTKGVVSGIEKANKIFMPLLWALAVVLVARALTLDGALSGINWYLQPDFERLLDHNVWLAAYGQIFFTLCLGSATMIAYSSYLPEGTDIVNNAFIVSFANCAFSFLMGFAVFGTLGYMAATTGQDVGDVVASGIGLAFVVFPKALTLLPGLKVPTAVVFFTCLVVAGLSSLISMVEAFAAALMDKFGLGRAKAVNMAIGLGLLGSLIFATKGGLYWLDIIDHLINVYGILLVGSLEAIAIGWIYGGRRIREWANARSDVMAGVWWDVSIKLIVPLVLAFLIADETISDLKASYGGYPTSAIYLGAAVMGLGMAISVMLSMVRKEVD